MDRLDSLLSIVKIRRPIAEAVQQLSKFGWDSDVELVELTSEDFRHLLSLYVDGEVTAADCELWADALEVRDDVGFKDDAKALADVMFELANPVLTSALTRERAAELILRLSSG